MLWSPLIEYQISIWFFFIFWYFLFFGLRLLFLC
jgi:hypothetical protein